MKAWLKYKILFFKRRRNLVLLGAFFYLFSCGNQQDKYYENKTVGGVFGTSYNIIYQTKKQINFQLEIDSVFKAVNQSMSTYLPTSDISKINNGDSTLIVDHMFKDVFQLSKKINKITDGYFDPTVGVLVNAWGFGPGTQLKMDSTRVDSLMNYVGFDKVKLTPENKIKKKNSAVQFDFNAIAKGYAIDRLAIFMDSKGVENYLLEVGGEVVVKGMNKIKKKPWTTAIEDPQVIGNKRVFKKIIHLKNKALASSGNYRKFRIDSITGEKYVHTINPKTGFTKNSKIVAANVLANTCAEADAYATAFMAMNLNNTKMILQADSNVEAYIIYLDEKGITKEFMSEGFKTVVVK